ncbi:ABC transporter ATP-binding protein [Maribacter algicola]|uniref:ABC transporter ATP-binding protein n=1 Tax=Meishania litoralis TaxID=3434685 RepID=A0ACC7LM26_9FLAO
MDSKEQHITLKTENLSIGYTSKNSEILVAKNIDLNAQLGELVAIIGINGIGKSTLLRTLAQVQPKLAGTIKIGETDLNNMKSFDLASEISVVLTEPIASKNLTVIELVALGRQPYTNWLGTLSEQDLAKVKEGITQMELGSLQHKKCHELSDGQLQRAMIARALAQDTPVILLDEPTTHLDLYHKVRILKLLKHIAKETDKIIIFTTHEIEMAIRLCDEILLLDGHTNPFGKPNELIEKKAFERIFPSDTITFDPDTGSFRI